MRILQALVALGAAVVASSGALAQGLDSSASASATITVIIPPIAPAIAAQDQGAVGLWSMTDNANGLMIKLAGTARPDAPATLTLYAPAFAADYIVRRFDGDQARMSAFSRGSFRGLRRTDFAVNASPSNLSHSMTVVIATP